MTVVLIEIDGIVQDTSTTSLTVGTGLKSLTTDTAQPFKIGMTVTIDDGAGNTMTGAITVFSGDSMTVNVASVTGSGTIAAWVVRGCRCLDFASRGYQQKSGDTEPARFYEGALASTISFEHYLFSKGTTFGKSSTGVGDIYINDPAGDYDFAIDLGFSGQQVRIKTLESEQSAYSTAVTKFTGTLKIMDYNWQQKIFSINDKLSELDKPAQEEVFDGSNSGATGIEGTEDDLEGKTKPFAYGFCATVAPPQVNSSLLIYGTNFDSTGSVMAVNAIDNVRDSGLALVLDTGVGTSGDVADLAALQAASITAGQYATCLAEGLFRLESSPAGVVTCDVTEGATAADRTAGQIAKRLLEDRGGFTSDDYETTAITALDSANSSVLGVYVNTTARLHDVITSITTSIGGNVFENSSGKFDFARVVDPSGETSQLTLLPADIIEAPSGGISRVPAKDIGGGVPAKQVKIHYKKNFFKFGESNFAGAVTDSDRAFFLEEFRLKASTKNVDVEAKHANAPVMEFTSLLTVEANAETELTRLESVYDQNRAFYEVMTRADTLLEVGQVLTLKLPRFGYSAGKKVLIIGRVLLFGRNRVIYAVWG